MALIMTTCMAETSIASEYSRTVSKEKKTHESPIQTIQDMRLLQEDTSPSSYPSSTPSFDSTVSPSASAPPSLSQAPSVKASASPTQVLVTSPSPTSSPSESPTDENKETSNDKKLDEEESLGIFFGLMIVAFVFLGYKAYQRRKRQLILRDRQVVSSDPNHAATNTHLSEFYIDDNELI